MDCCQNESWWRRLTKRVRHNPKEHEEQGPLKKVALVGNPNVGKSVLFNRLTGVYVVVSNYPGTTVEVSRGRGRFGGVQMEVIDTPGMYSLLPITEEERVARRLLISEHPSVVLHVVDGRNLERMLPLTLQLIEAGQPLILVINVMDEARRLGICIDTDLLAARLGVPVVPVAATLNEGIDLLRKKVAEIAAYAA
ncbi:MAG: FeoB small GTPase domain-containing protein [bacterium]